MNTSEVNTTGICIQCSAQLVVDDVFCESCGAPTGIRPPETIAETTTTPTMSTATGAAAVSPSAGDASQTLPNPVVRICVDCKGLIAQDGYCSSCGAKGRSERDHWNEQPVPWAAAVCDRGIRHHRNEDAVALAAAEEPGSFAALVVCDGVSTSSNSDVASLAAVHAAVAVLRACADGRSPLAQSGAMRPGAAGTKSGEWKPPLISARPLSGVASETSESVATRLVSISSAIERAGADAQAVVAAVTATELSEHPSPPSCTFVVAVLLDSLIVTGWVGDSRAYWLPDEGGAELLSIDHSVATEMMRAGATRVAAESSADAHAITRWLGVDTPNSVPQIGTTTVRSSGWLLVCSDGLWNYCSDPFAVDALVRELSEPLIASPVETADPCELGEAMVAWANTQGGHDNISVVLARVPAPKA